MFGKPLQLPGLVQVIHLVQQRALDLLHHALHHHIAGQRQVAVRQSTQGGTQQAHVRGDGRGNARVLHLDRHGAMPGQLGAVHLAQAGGSKGLGLEAGEQGLGLLPEGLAEHPAHQRAVERRGLVAGARQLAPHALGQKTGVHAQDLRHLERRAAQLPHGLEQDAAHGRFVAGLGIGLCHFVCGGGPQALAQLCQTQARGREAGDGAARERAGAGWLGACHARGGF